MASKNYLFQKTTDLKTVIESLDEYLVEYTNTDIYNDADKEKIVKVINSMQNEAIKYFEKNENQIANPTIEELFSKMSDQSKISLFMQRSNSGIPSIFEECIDVWQVNRY